MANRATTQCLTATIVMRVASHRMVQESISCAILDASLELYEFRGDGLDNEALALAGRACFHGAHVYCLANLLSLV